MTTDAAVSVSNKFISSAAARSLVSAAIAHADKNAWHIAVAVVDAAGHVVASARMDGVPAVILEFATDKAYTAAMMRKTTLDFFERMAATPELAMGVASRPRLLCWQGGVAIQEAGAFIGGIGVSGATGPEDAQCATEALAQLGLVCG